MVYRRATKRFLRNVDNQFRVATSAGGLKFFVRDKQKATWADKAWRQWPYLLLILDLGPDNVCGVLSLMYHYEVNCDLIADWSHGGNRDVWLALGAATLRQFFLLMMMVWNTPMGPKDTQEWDNAITQCFASIKKKFKPSTAPLFFRQCTHDAARLGEARGLLTRRAGS